MKMLSGFKSSRLNGVIRTVLISVATFLLIFVLILAGISPDTYDIHVGEPASKTIYATKDVEDTVTTEQLRVAAANAVEPSYKSVDISVNGVVLENMRMTFDALLSIKAEWQDKLGAAATESQLAQINQGAPFTLSQDMVSTLIHTGEEAFFDVGRLFSGREHEDGEVIFTVPKESGKSETIRAGKGCFQQHQINAAFFEGMESFFDIISKKSPVAGICKEKREPSF